jgi:hypothetical protein
MNPQNPRRSRTSLHPRAAALVAALLATAALSHVAAAFSLEGTADLDLSPGGDEGATTFVALAGFEIERRGDGWYLVAFAEIGPDTVIAGRFGAAGQLWLRIPVAGRAGSIDGVFDGDDPDLLVSYVEWERSGASRQESAVTGTVGVVSTWSDAAPLHADVTVLLDVTLDDGATRRLEGALFGGSLAFGDPSLPPNYEPPVRTRYYRRYGCGGEPEVVYGVDYYDGYGGYDYYDDDDGSCAGSSTEAEVVEDTQSEGCEGDTTGSSSSDSSSSEGCEGDTIGDDGGDDEGEGDEGTDSDGPDCATDDCEGDDGTAEAGWRLPIRAKDIHLWLPLAFVLLARRRRGPAASGPGC